MTAYCTFCWAELGSDSPRCPQCGKDPALDTRTFAEKLNHGLAHPLPEARARCCWVIGQAQKEECLPALAGALNDPDAYVRLAAVDALGRFKGLPAPVRKRLEEMAERDTFLIRAAARKLVSPRDH
jgi:HEAT repeat protein